MTHTGPEAHGTARRGGRSVGRCGAPLSVIAAAASAAVLAAVLGTTTTSVAVGGPLVWSPCVASSTEYECAHLVVPMDRHDPDGATFTLRVARHRSTGSPDRRIGTLVYLPGGPGGAGAEEINGEWLSLPEQVRERFDLVSWDPRGTGGTTPAPRLCVVPTDRSNPYRVGPIDWRTVGDQSRRATAQWEAACEARNAAIVAHLGTNENVSDLDTLRAALGENALTLWGVSFGTRIGAVYALTYPARVRAMLLDGPLDPSSGWPPPAYYAAAGANSFGWVTRYFPAAGRQFQQVLAEVARHPVRLSRDLWIDRFTVPMYVYRDTWDQTLYARIAERVGQLHDAVYAAGAVRDAARQAVRLHMGGVMAEGYAGATSVVAAATYCLDVSARPTVDELLPLTRRTERRYGAYAAAGVLSSAVDCHGFTFAPDPIPLVAAGSGPSVPLLVFGSTDDPRTPGAGIDALRDAFPGARSVTYRGSQHVIWTSILSACVTRPGSAFLLSGEVPLRDATCANTYEKPGVLVD